VHYRYKIYLPQILNQIILKTVTTFIFGIFLCFALFAQDTQPPVMTSFSFSPSSVNVSSSPANLTFSANITDNSSGVNTVIVAIQLPNGTLLNGTAALISGTNLSGVWQTVFVIPQLSQAGTGNLVQIILFDNSNNPRSYSSANFPMGSTPTFTVINTNPSDNVAPTLASFAIAPIPVDVSTSSKIITITANLTDNLSGVRTVSANIKLPNGSTINSFGTLPLPLTALDGLWEMQFTIPKFTLGGPANIISLNAVDTSGNQITYTAKSMPILGTIGDTTFTITNTNPDNTAPSLNSFTVSPSSVNITLATQNITVRATATDNIAGVRSASITIRLPNGTFQSTNAVYDIMSTSTLNGQWDAVFTIPLQTSPGTGQVFQLTLLDSANISRVYASNALTLLGPNFTIVNDNVVLPVQWLKPVTASIQNRYSRVEWSTASQINNEKFVIEHSNNGKEFYEVGEQTAQGNTTESREYNFIHEDPSSGMNYYRIKQMDFDGKYSYSNIASVSYNSKEFMIFPNPVGDEATISTTHDNEMNVYDVHGRLVLSKFLNAGQNPISMTELSTGIYFLLLQNGERYKFIKE
jgi:Secretion system C-terminal sorting domain